MLNTALFLWVRLTFFGEVCLWLSRLVRFGVSEGHNRGLRGSTCTSPEAVFRRPANSGRRES